MVVVDRMDLVKAIRHRRRYDSPVSSLYPGSTLCSSASAQSSLPWVWLESLVLCSRFPQNAYVSSLFIPKMESVALRILRKDTHVLPQHYDGRRLSTGLA